MAKLRGTSNAPMILGIIGGVLGLPAAVCSGACAAGFSGAVSETTEAAVATGNVFMYLGLIGSIIAIIFASLSKKNPTLAGIMLIVAAVFNGITLITFNILSFVVVVLILIAAILSFTQKKETIE